MQFQNINSKGSWFLPALTLLFVAAKITGYIGWSWWLVFLPMWGPLLALLVIAAFFGAVWLFASYMDRRTSRKRK